jgi:hypothetical protein
MNKLNTSVCIALAACAVSPSLIAGGERMPAYKASPVSKKEQPSNPWITAQQKHNGSGVQLRYRIMGVPQVGQPLDIQIEFTASQDDANVSMRIDKALSVQASNSWQKTSLGMDLPLSKSGKNAQTLQVIPSAEGTHFIRMRTSQNGRASMASIAVQVGPLAASQPTLGTLTTTPAGEKMITMPAK